MGQKHNKRNTQDLHVVIYVTTELNLSCYYYFRTSYGTLKMLGFFKPILSKIWTKTPAWLFFIIELVGLNVILDHNICHMCIIS